METKLFPCSSEGLASAQAFLESWCPEPKPGIITDEVVSNIVRCSHAKEFSISLDRLDDGSIKMVFDDDGIAFDPTTEVATPDVTASLEDRQIGGLGMFMVKKMSKSVAYRRADDRNVLTVVI